MLEVVIPAIISFIVAFLAIPVVILIADKKKLYDIPDERKLHTHTIASLGGVGIFLGFIFSVLLSINFSKAPEFQYFFAAALIIFFIGLKDDILVLSAFKKFATQLICAAIIIHLGGIQISSLYGIAGIGAIDAVYGIPLTYITIILIVNAFNLIDGIDGLAGSLGLMATLLLGTYFLLAAMPAYAAFAYALSASLAAFLIFNYHPAKIFMGDSGSLLIGMVCSILVLKFISVAGAPNSALHMSGAEVAIGISLLIIPLVDTLRVFAIRIMKGRSPFSPDRNHVHHLLLDRGFGHAGVTLTCLLANIIIVAAVYMCRSLGNTIIIGIMFSAAFLIMGILYFTLPKRKMVLRRRFAYNRANTNSRQLSKVIKISRKEPIVVEQVKG